MKNIYILDDEEKLKNDLTELFEEDDTVKVKKYSPEKFNYILRKVPDVLIINEDALNDSEKTLEMCKKIRADQDNAIIPIIVISSNIEQKHIVEIMKNEVELYLEKPVDNKIIYYSVKNFMRLLGSNRMVSPLTGLPGNVQIQAEMKNRLKNGEDFAMLYLDLDNFKAYNDTYGFSNGDELIKFTAKTISKFVLKDNDSDNFVGHIGGDDFVAIVEGLDYEKICQNIIAEFDSQVVNYYNDEDVERGYIEGENRKGIVEQFPLTSISIGVVEVTPERFKNTLEIGECGAAVKHLAKTIFGSTYVIDRRRNREERPSKTLSKKK